MNRSEYNPEGSALVDEFVAEFDAWEGAKYRAIDETYVVEREYDSGGRGDARVNVKVWVRAEPEHRSSWKMVGKSGWVSFDEGDYLFEQLTHERDVLDVVSRQPMVDTCDPLFDSDDDRDVAALLDHLDSLDAN
jgi:hypothetical protein